MSAFGGKADIDQPLLTNLDYEYTTLLAFRLLLSVFPGIGPLDLGLPYVFHRFGAAVPSPLRATLPVA
jgi:hypothetical protein